VGDWPGLRGALHAEFEVKGEDIGFTPIDVGGSGIDVPLEGNTLEERAEVWFTKK
jgi:hypothetical protein